MILSLLISETSNPTEEVSSTTIAFNYHSTKHSVASIKGSKSPHDVKYMLLGYINPVSVNKTMDVSRSMISCAIKCSATLECKGFSFQKGVNFCSLLEEIPVSYLGNWIEGCMELWVMW